MVKRIREKGKTAYHKADLVYTSKMKDQMSWKRLERAYVMEGKVENKISEVEMISTEMIAQDSEKRCIRDKT